MRPPIQIWGASAIGPLHRQLGLPGQDAHQFEVIPSGSAVIALADGLGSASRSDQGARTAVDRAVERIKSDLLPWSAEGAAVEELAYCAVHSARRALEDLAQKQACALRDLSCTLMVLIFHGGALVTAHLGDGAVVAETERGLILVSEPAPSEYTNEVTPLTHPQWEAHLRFNRVQGELKSIAAFTDGLQRAGLKKGVPGWAPFPGFFHPLFSFFRALEPAAAGEDEIKGLLDSAKLCANSEDDKTLVIAVINPEGRGDP